MPSKRTSLRANLVRYGVASALLVVVATYYIARLRHWGPSWIINSLFVVAVAALVLPLLPSSRSKDDSQDL
jgi:hypothetical protein